MPQIDLPTPLTCACCGMIFGAVFASNKTAPNPQYCLQCGNDIYAVQVFLKSWTTRTYSSGNLGNYTQNSYDLNLDYNRAGVGQFLKSPALFISNIKDINKNK